MICRRRYTPYYWGSTSTFAFDASAVTVLQIVEQRGRVMLACGPRASGSIRLRGLLWYTVRSTHSGYAPN